MTGNIVYQGNSVAENCQEPEPSKQQKCRPHDPADPAQCAAGHGVHLDPWGVHPGLSQHSFPFLLPELAPDVLLDNACKSGPVSWC